MPKNNEKQLADKHQKVLQGLREGAAWAIEQLYRNTYPMVRTFIKKNNGTENDAQDLFQDALLAFIPKLRTMDFELRAAPSTYLYAIVRNQWLTRLRKNKKNPVDLVLDEPESSIQLIDVVTENTPEEEGFYKLVTKSLQQLGIECQKIIRFKHIYRYSHEEIVATMESVNSVSYSRLKLNNCMKQLRKRIKEHSELNRS